MIVSSASALSASALAIALGKGVKHASRTFLSEVKMHAYQHRAPEGVAPHASEAVLSGAFLFRVVLKGNQKDAGMIKTLDNARLATGCAKLLATDPAAFGRIAEGKGKVCDCVDLLQLAIFGNIWHDSQA